MDVLTSVLSQDATILTEDHYFKGLSPLIAP